MTPDEARGAFASSPVARLATADASGAPHLVPIVFAADGNRIFTTVDAKPKRPGRLYRLENIAVNPRVSLLVDHYDADWRRLWWARADGSARVVESGLELDHAVALLRARYAQYRDTELMGPVIVVEVERWTGWSAAG